MAYAKIIIKKFDGTKKECITDKDSCYGISAIGYSFRENNKIVIIHPSNFASLTIEEFKD